MIFVFKCRHGPLTGLARSGGLAVYYLIRIGGSYRSCAPDEGIGPTGFLFSSVGTAPWPGLCDQGAWRFIIYLELAGFIVVAATHDTSYQNDAGGITDCSRWLSEATPSGFVSVKRLAPRPGCKSFFASCSGG